VRRCLEPGGARRTHQDCRRLIRHAGVAAAADTGLMVATLIGILVLSNLDRMPHGIAGFLSLRITVKNVVTLAVLITVWPMVFHVCGLYQRRRLVAWPQEAARVALACAIASWMAVLFAITSISGYFRTVNVIELCLTSTTVLLATRAGRRLVMRVRGPQVRRVVIVGLGPRGQSVLRELRETEYPRYDVLALVDTVDRLPRNGEWPGRVLATPDQLESVLMRQAIDEVFITLPVGSHYQEIRQTIEICERVGVLAKYRADIVDSQLAWPTYDGADGIVTMRVAPNDSRLLLKRGIDIVVGSLALLAFLPLMAVIAVTIKMTSQGPVLFPQVRYGLNKRAFRMYKFRTMVQNAEKLQDALEDRNEMDGPVFKIRNDPRITRIGRFLRRTSLDELPQLVHVVTGKMSLVGPRPMPLRDVARFTRPADMRRFSVRPGLTCLWQISGRNNLGFDDWITLDLTYIDFWSVVLDLRILVRTIPTVLRGLGAS
jgi:exopolysaccharide biosynthesis polyprenyl glycosylphosphotransferase